MTRAVTKPMSSFPLFAPVKATAVSGYTVVGQPPFVVGVERRMRLHVTNTIKRAVERLNRDDLACVPLTVFGEAAIRC